MKAIDVIKTMCFTLENQVIFVCDGLVGEDYTKIPNGGEISIGWLVGHIIMSHEFIVNTSILGLEPLLDKDFLHKFKTGSKGVLPEGLTGADLLENLKWINSIIVKEILSKDDSWLDDMPKKTDKFPPNYLNKNNLKVLMLAINHGITHTGQIIEIKKRLGKGGWGF